MSESHVNLEWLNEWWELRKAIVESDMSPIAHDSSFQDQDLWNFIMGVYQDGFVNGYERRAKYKRC